MTTELFDVVRPDHALERLWAYVTPSTDVDRVPVLDAVGRVVGAEIRAPEQSPAFRRSVMDGYAVRASDTFGASEGLPSFLGVRGEVPMGAAATQPLEVGTAQLIHTGGMLPPAANAVVMVEHTQMIGDESIEVVRPVAPGENVVQPGEDIAVGDVILAGGQVVRPQDAGALAALGILELDVRRRPRLAILASGDEVVPPSQAPAAGQVRDVNSTALAALARTLGAEPQTFGIAPDDPRVLTRMVTNALAASDLLVVSAGSSVSTRDLTATVLGSLGEPGVLVHGVAVKPGKPTIIAASAGKPLFGLPGNPVSALVIFDLLVAPVIRRLLGMRSDPAVPTVRAKLARNISSATGRVDYVQARLTEREGEMWAEPVFGKSNLIFTMSRASGMIRVPLDLAGLREGSWVDVRIF